MIPVEVVIEGAIKMAVINPVQIVCAFPDTVSIFKGANGIGDYERVPALRVTLTSTGYLMVIGKTLQEFTADVMKAW